MSINLVSLVSENLTPGLIGRISTALGLDRSLIGQAATALAPAHLGSLSHVASSPDGARKLAGAIGQQSPSILETLEFSIGGSGQQSLVREGISTLSSLLGGSAVSALTGAVGKLTGISQGAGSSLLGMLAPAVLGTLGKQQAAHGLDASGLAQLLASQKENISAGFTIRIWGYASSSRSTGVPNSQRPGPSKGARFPYKRRKRPSIRELALGSWGGRRRGIGVVDLWKPAGGIVEQTRTTRGRLSKTCVDGVDLKSSLPSALAGLKTTVQDVSDAASAKAALPELEKEAAEFERFSRPLREAARRQQEHPGGPYYNSSPCSWGLFDKVLTIPGVDAIAKPAIDTLRVKLNSQ